MAAKAEILTTGELIVLPESVPALTVFTDEAKLQPYLDMVRKELDAFVPDIATPKGRKEIAAIAFRVSQTKTYLEGVGKALADEQKAIPKKIDACRKLAKDTLDKWRDEIRKPLTDWEEAEKAREQKHVDALERIQLMAAPVDAAGIPYSADTLRNRLSTVRAIKVNAATCEEFELQYLRARDATISDLEVHIERRAKHEAELAELEAHRKEKVEREAKERDDKIRRDAEDKAKRDAEAAAQAAKDKADADARAEREAAERREAQLKKDAEDAQRRADENEARLKREADEAKRRADETEARVKREAEEAKAKEARDAEARERDKKNKAAVMKRAVVALVAAGIDVEVATKVVTLIATRAVPAVRIEF